MGWSYSGIGQSAAPIRLQRGAQVQRQAFRPTMRAAARRARPGGRLQYTAEQAAAAAARADERAALELQLQQLLLHRDSLRIQWAQANRDADVYRKAWRREKAACGIASAVLSPSAVAHCSTAAGLKNAMNAAKARAAALLQELYQVEARIQQLRILLGY